MTGTQEDDLRTVCWDLPDDLSVIGKVRAMVRETVTAWGLSELDDDVLLVVGELLANAFTHGRPPVRLSLWLTVRELCVRVTDHGAESPRRLELGPEAVHGRGLAIVRALTHGNGVTPLPDGGGKTVWCRWDLSLRTADLADGG